MIRRSVLAAALLLSSLASHAISMTAGDTQASEKIKYMQHISGTDSSRLAALIQTDQTFTQWCGRPASVPDLKRIASQQSFSELYDRLKSGQVLGMTQTKALLVNDNPKFCKR
ncbi:hypothetical protein DFO55_12445 [Grimontella sp. AG753]|nr:hypothetical protein DFO55_12445 [Grimontella sp. AG753]